MGSFIFLSIVFGVVLLIILGLYLNYRKNTKVDRFAAKHPEAVWIWYDGPKSGVLILDGIERSQGLEFDSPDGRRGFVVLPGPVQVQVSYYNVEDIEGSSFTQTLQFTAVSNRNFFLQVNEKNRIISVLPQ